MKTVDAILSPFAVLLATYDAQIAVLDAAIARAEAERIVRPAAAVCVEIRVRNVGQNFGCTADLRDVMTCDVLATTGVRPHGARSGAYADAEALAAAKGWRIKEEA